jgi:hypothetical protein
MAIGIADQQPHVARATALSSGWLWLHESGTYVKFTQAGTELFA